jgi:hypothetical protein
MVAVVDRLEKMDMVDIVVFVDMVEKGDMDPVKYGSCS